MPECLTKDPPYLLLYELNVLSNVTPQLRTLMNTSLFLHRIYQILHDPKSKEKKYSKALQKHVLYVRNELPVESKYAKHL